MRSRNNMINRVDANMIRCTHPVVTDTQSADGHVPTFIDVIQPSDRTSTTIHLTPIEKKAIEAQDNIGQKHFIRGRTANDFAPAIQQYYTNNKIKPFSESLRWSIAINKCNFLIHQSVWKKYYSEIASPVRTKNKILQRKLYLLSLVEKYYNQAADLPKLQSQWFDRTLSKYQKQRAQDLINWFRTAKRIIRKKSSKKKDLTENPNNKSEYTALDNTADEKLPIISKPLVHTIQRISQKKELDKLINPLIST